MTADKALRLVEGWARYRRAVRGPIEHAADGSWTTNVDTVLFRYRKETGMLTVGAVVMTFGSSWAKRPSLQRAMADELALDPASAPASRFGLARLPGRAEPSLVLEGDFGDGHLGEDEFDRSVVRLLEIAFVWSNRKLREVAYRLNEQERAGR